MELYTSSNDHCPVRAIDGVYLFYAATARQGDEPRLTALTHATGSSSFDRASAADMLHRLCVYHFARQLATRTGDMGVCRCMSALFCAMQKPYLKS